MRKLSYIISFFAFVLCLCSCGEDIKTCSGRIKELTESTMVAVTGGKDVTFDIRRVRYDNGIVMTGDSVGIHYVGRLGGEAHAVLIHLIPRQGEIVTIGKEADTSKELKTKDEPMTEQERRGLNNFINDLKRRGR